MIKRTLFLILLMALLVYVQTTFLNQLAFNNVKPDIALIVLVFIAVRYGSTQGALIGFIAGLMEDFISLSPLGFHSFILTLIGFLAGLGSNLISVESRFFQVFSLVAATFVKYLLSAIIISIFTITKKTGNLMNSVFVIELIYNSILAPVVFWIGNWTDLKLSRKA